MKKLFAMLAMFCFAATVSAQNLTQSIRGVIVDKQSQSPLPGATVVILNSSPQLGTTSDVDGKFTLAAVAIGRVNVQISFIGYNPVVMNNLILTSGKELILNVALEEKVSTLNEIAVVAEQDKKQAINQLTTVSARSFTIEETNRYAGSLGDPSRMAANYAGVAVAGDSRNDIVIRGNSPLGLLWRLDGINIPNPNHFGSLGTTGGPVSILNNNMLDNSDFMTGAFPAEYGNALSGAFDLKMRTGNNEKREFIGQVGMNGFELGAEGPFNAKHKSSYLVNYRYSTLDFFDAVGINFGYGSIPQYQDVSFKLDFPTGTKYGRLSLFGIGGKSFIELLDKDKKEDDFTVAGFAQDVYFASDMGVVGLSHKYFFNENTRQVINIAVSGTQNIMKADSLYNNKQDKILRYGNHSYEVKTTISYNLNKKFNSKNTFNTGFNADMLKYKYADSTLKESKNFIKLTGVEGNSVLLQAHFTWQHKFSDALLLNVGVHEQYFELNESNAIEPRAGLKWKITEKQSLSFGYGMHSQTLPMSVYLYETQLSDGSYLRTNESLDFSKSNHYVIGYDYSLATNLRIKAEAYYQELYNIPVEKIPSASSGLNVGADYVIPNDDSLVNKGTGKNIGIELTIEKFLSKNYYFLITASLYDSKYKGSDGIEHNTIFNGNYTLNVLAGAEFNIDKDKRKVLFINGKTNYAGGKRYTPVLLEASKMYNTAIYDENQIFEKKYTDYSRTDVKIGFKLNGKKTTQEWAFDVQNVFNTKNIFQQIYNPVKQDMQTEYQLGVFPMVTYRILF